MYRNRQHKGGVPRVDTKFTQFLSRENMGLLDFVMNLKSATTRLI